MWGVLGKTNPKKGAGDPKGDLRGVGTREGTQWARWLLRDVSTLNISGGVNVRMLSVVLITTTPGVVRRALAPQPVMHNERGTAKGRSRARLEPKQRSKHWHEQGHSLCLQVWW